MRQSVKKRYVDIYVKALREAKHYSEIEIDRIIRKIKKDIILINTC